MPGADRFSPRDFDWLAAGTTLVLALPAIMHAAARGQLAIGLAALPVATLPLLWRRSHPAAVLVVLGAVLAVSVAVGKSVPSNVGVLFALYAAARYGGLRLRITSGAIAGAAGVATFLMMLATDRARLYPHLTAAVVFGAGGAWVLGEAVRTRRAYLVQLEDRAARLERERDEHARRAAEEERIRIARELHDVVTHQVSVIAVQAGAAHSTSSARPERALDALGVIERTARSTLAELRALLGVLRAGENPAPLAPVRPRPSIAQLDELVAQARAAGITVGAQVRGIPVPLDAVVELGAYRVLQEALTNVIKHAPGSRATVLVEYLPGEVRITVHDDGPVRASTDQVGHGLIGMRERVELAGGELVAGPAPDGGFRVQASLPIKRRAAANDGGTGVDATTERDHLVSA